MKVFIKNINTLMEMLKGVKYMRLSLILLAMTSAISPITAYLYKILIDELSRDGFSYTYLIGIICVYIVMQIIGEIIENLENHINMLRELGVQYNLNQKVINKVKKIKIEYFDGVEEYNLIQRILNRLEAELINTMDTILAIVPLIISTFASAVVLSYVKWYFPIILIISNIPYFFLLISQNKRNYSQYKKNNTKERYLQYWINVLTSREYIKEIRIFHLVEYLSNKVRILQSEIFTTEYALEIRNFVIDLSIGFVRNLSVGVCLFLTLYLINCDANVTIGTFVLVYNIASETVNNLTVTISQLAGIGKLKLYLEDWRKFNLLEEENCLPQKKISTVDNHFSLLMRNVSFHYPGQKIDIIKCINLEIHSGEKIAIVGVNGSGKSTLLNLMLGLYEINSGELIVGDYSVNDMGLNRYRSYFSVMFQNFVKFQLSVKDNIFLDNGEIDNKILDEIIDFQKILPKGQDTILGQLEKEGIEVSGGQWQKLALARACARKDAKVLVFDEPTSNLDLLSEKRVLQYLFNNFAEKTIIIATHNMELCKLCDKIIVMNEGNIVECDSFDVLMQKKDKFYNMYRSQKGI